MSSLLKMLAIESHAVGYQVLSSDSIVKKTWDLVQGGLFENKAECLRHECNACVSSRFIINQLSICKM